MKDLYIRQLNKEDFNKVKVALVVALEELDALDTLEDALDSKLSDLKELIDVEKVLNSDIETYIENLEDTLIDTQKNIEKTYKRARTQYRKMYKMEMQARWNKTNVEEDQRYIATKQKYNKLIDQAQVLEKEANKTEEELKELSPQGYAYYNYYVDMLAGII